MLPAFDVLVVVAQPQASNEVLDGLANEWRLPIDDFLRRGGVMVVLDAPSTNAGTARVLDTVLPMTRATTTPGGIAQVSSPDGAAVGGVPLMFALGDSVGYRPSGYLDSVTSDSGDVVVAHRAFY